MFVHTSVVRYKADAARSSVRGGCTTQYKHYWYKNKTQYPSLINFKLQRALY